MKKKYRDIIVNDVPFVYRIKSDRGIIIWHDKELIHDIWFSHFGMDNEKYKNITPKIVAEIIGDLEFDFEKHKEV